MLLDFEYKNGKVIISEIDSHGNVVLNDYPWKNPKKFVICESADVNKHPTYTTWDKKSVKYVDTKFPNRFSIYEFIDKLPTDVKKRLNTYQEPKVFYVDIETEILDTGFVEPTEAISQVLTIAISNKNKVMVLGLKELDDNEILKIKNKIEAHFAPFNLLIDFKYKSFKDDEVQMLEYFFNILIPKMPVITGWNFLDYDWTFLLNRCRRLNIEIKSCSPTEKIETIFGTCYEVPAHKLVIDYMNIYKKWDTSIKVKESNSLDWVSEKILKIKKIKYDGTLSDLYSNDFIEYVFYNAVDTLLVQLINEKMRYIDIAYSISNLATIRLCDFAYKNLNCALVQTEGFLREKLRTEKNIIFCKDKEDDVDIEYAGGWVKPPVKGIVEDISVFDFSSLYPTVMRQFNISPETFIGFVDKDDSNYAIFNNTRTLIDSDNHIVCVNNAVFSRDYSVTVNFLENVFSERSRFKKLMNAEIEKYDSKMKEIELLEKELELLENNI